MFHSKIKLLLRLGLLTLLLVAIGLTIALPAYSQTNRYVDPTGVCNSLAPCYTAIGDAVAASEPGDIAYIFPGNYVESVDLGTMATPGTITLITVDATGAPPQARLQYPLLRARHFITTRFRPSPET